jgi:ABC-type sugar transport system substrate-binding protein
MPVVVVHSARRHEGALAVVGTDEYVAGRAAGEQLAERMEDRGQILVPPVDRDDPAVRERLRGVRDVLDQFFPKVKLVLAHELETARDLRMGEQREGHRARERVAGATRALLEDASEPRGILALDPRSTRGALQALRSTPCFSGSRDARSRSASIRACFC